MRKRIGFSLILALIVGAIFLYSKGQFHNGLPVSDYKPYPEYANPSKIIKTEVGKKFIISLESNRTTGYGWEIDKKLDKSLLKVVEIQHKSSSTTRVGASGTDLWTFEALRPGSLDISFEYVRPWEEEVLPAKTETFSVVIRK